MENGRDHEESEDETQPEPSPFVPDLGLPNDVTVSHGQEAAESGAIPKSGGGASAGGGGGEAPLSFRRFLEPSGGGGGGAVGLGRPDVAAGLPDFVQDHLSAAPPAGDGVRQRSPGAGAAASAATGTRRKVPTSLSCAAGGAAAPLSAGQPQGLPDFLSDGPMGTLHADSLGELHADPEANGESRRGASRLHQASSAQRVAQLERENASLRRDIDRLQQQLEYERRRFDQQPPSGAGAAESRLQEEVRALRRENTELRRRARAAPSAPSRHQAASRIVTAATGAEHLISQLMAGVRDLRTIAASMELPELDDEAGAAGGSPC